MQRHLTTQINISEAWIVRDHLPTTKYWCPEILEFARSPPEAEAANLFMSTQCVFSMEMTSIVIEGDCKTYTVAMAGQFFWFNGNIRNDISWWLLKFRSGSFFHVLG